MLNHHWALTAKHCVEGVGPLDYDLEIDPFTGNSDGIVRHPTEDVALVLLSSPILHVPSSA